MKNSINQSYKVYEVRNHKNPNLIMVALCIIHIRVYGTTSCSRIGSIMIRSLWLRDRSWRLWMMIRECLYLIVIIGLHFLWEFFWNPRSHPMPILLTLLSSAAPISLHMDSVDNICQQHILNIMTICLNILCPLMEYRVVGNVNNNLVINS